MNEYNFFAMAGRVVTDAKVMVECEKSNLVRFGIFLNTSKVKEGQKYPASMIVNFEAFVKKDDKETMELLKKGKSIKLTGFYDVDCYTDKDGKEVKKEVRKVKTIKAWDGNIEQAKEA